MAVCFIIYVFVMVILQKDWTDWAKMLRDANRLSLVDPVAKLLVLIDERKELLIFRIMKKNIFQKKPSLSFTVLWLLSLIYKYFYASPPYNINLIIFYLFTFMSVKAESKELTYSPRANKCTLWH